MTFSSRHVAAVGLQIAFGWAFVGSHIDEMAAMGGGLSKRGLSGAALVDAGRPSRTPLEPTAEVAGP
ncbi:hypothetical protein [Agrococcus lahaulensis]|uniref:hypothetical protein n=1 Tax=Agrococcus lahaulensis TaxID=341722 RepID=UPI000478B72C|nr:hypothetical protein [Agrococcus lahaulensis]